MNPRSPLAPYAEALLSWHRDITQRSPPRGRLLGQGAELRRASSLGEVALLAGFHSLRTRLREAGFALEPRAEPKLALVAALLAKVREHRPGAPSLATRLGSPVPKTERSVLSPLRFRQLLEREEAAELLRPLSTVIALLDAQLDVLELAEAAFGWGLERRKRWAYDYYDACPEPGQSKKSKKGEAA